MDDVYIYQKLKPYLASEDPNAKGWYDAYCPIHDDTTRSAGFNFKEGIWSCRVNCGGGDLKQLVARLEAREDHDFEPIDTPSTSGGRVRRKVRRQNRAAPTEDDLEAMCERLLSDDALLGRFQIKRGLNDEVLREFQIGWSDEDNAYVIPIKDADGLLLNVRLYRTNAQATKIWSWGGADMDPNAIFPERVLKENDRIIICEGEWDALMLNQHGFPAVTGTTGAKQWQHKWNRKFTGKDVFICYDLDRAGDEATDKVATNLTDVARSVSIIKLPMEWREKDGLDVTDFFHKIGKTAEDFRAVMLASTVMAPPKDGEAIEVSVKESFSDVLTGNPMAMTVSVVGKSSEVHLLPKSMVFTCSMNADKLCNGCPMFDASGHIDLDIAKSDPVILQLRDIPERGRNEALREHIGAHKCGRMDLLVKDFMTTEVLIVRSSIEHTDDEGDTRSRTVVNVGKYATEANRTVRLVGTTYPSPREQLSTFQSWELEPVESSLDNYELNKEDIERMLIFQTRGHETPLQKMGDIARDMSENVTLIVGEERLGLHIAMDLVWHSALSFDFDGYTIDRGWMELLVVGDARTGKSEVASKLTRHYGSGRVVSCESASIPGILGAVKPMSGKREWTLEWGALPLNDKRLVVLDEVAGLTTDQIGQLSSVRSSGKAEIIKAETEVTNARTRQIWLSNPRDNKEGMADFLYGVMAIQPVIGNQEDIARFDLAMTVKTDDVDMGVINQQRRNTRPHTYTADRCHALVRWVWSRKREDIVWQEGATEEVYKVALQLGAEFSPDPPLIQGQNVRQKVSRIAVAIAARTFSTDSTHTKIVVKRAHVRDAKKFIMFLYGNDKFGYLALSRRRKEHERNAIASLDEVKQYLYTRPGLSRFLIGSNGQFRRQQMEEMLNYPKEEANLVIQRLASMSMIESAGGYDGYRIKRHLNTILKET